MHRYLFTSILALAVVGTATAQHGHGHGGHGHGGHGGHGHGGHSFSHGHGGHFYGHGHYHGHLHGYPAYGFGVYVGPRYSYGYPYSADPYYYRSYYDPAAQPPLSGPVEPARAMPSNKARIQVILPDPEARVLIDNAETSASGRVRLFDPPALEPGYTYSYKITAFWNQGSQPVRDVRQVSFTAGSVTVVDFTRPAAAESLPAPTAVPVRP